MLRYLYRAIDSTGDTIDFMLSPNRDAIAAKHFLQLALARAGEVRPQMINVAARTTSFAARDACARQ